MICVVEEPLDILAIERAGAYAGLYHVLHGSLNPMDGVGPDQLKVRELFTRLGDSGVAGGGVGHQRQLGGRGDRKLPRTHAAAVGRSSDAPCPRPSRSGPTWNTPTNGHSVRPWSTASLWRTRAMRAAMVLTGATGR